MSQILTFLIIAVIASATEAMFTGSATWFEPGLSACGPTYTGKDRIVAVAQGHWKGSDTNHDAMCRKSISVSDANSPNVTLTIPVTDECGSCAMGDLDMSKACFEQFYPSDKGRFNVQWTFV